MSTSKSTTVSVPSLLLLDASPRGERSHSRKLAQEYLANWQAAHPTGNSVTRDLGHEPPPFVNEAWVEGAFTPAEGHSTAARAAIRVSDRYVDELIAADEVVIATPIYNLTIPAVLKAWIDQISRYGRTFTRGENGFVGLLGGKRVRIIVSSGSDFRPASPGGAYNFLDGYLRAFFGFVGITDVTFVYAHSLNDGNPLRETSLAEASATVQSLATAA
ncbi:FMN-dependent NADH-azoreductase [Nibricoccus aquaticus]|uniref:FMN dependent NADH:quinone oxidoreductase n=1 Tax=Nibricoccus aquaticus TaxID=2576891 RepID=A0A290QNS6_9BACT|nr:NAD(P)H-dependent oxidoreductase [Nibricoccus aquaticus]ATC66062.1 FMN-dependent NADH-azoreductase [Nibricoccus aquaticus]